MVHQVLSYVVKEFPVQDVWSRFTPHYSWLGTEAQGFGLFLDHFRLSNTETKILLIHNENTKKRSIEQTTSAL